MNIILQGPIHVNCCPRAKLAESSGDTHSGEQEGESQPFRGWKGKEFPACEPEKGHGQVGSISRHPAAGAGRRDDPEKKSTLPGSPAFMGMELPCGGREA